MSYLHSFLKGTSAVLCITMLSACGGSSGDSDSTAPVITLNGDSNVSLVIGDEYVEQGATAQDDSDGSVQVTISGQVNTQAGGEYTVTYSATDSSGNRATQRRTVTVVDNVAPVITITGSTVTNVGVNTEYVEAGAVAIDETDGNVEVIISGSVNTEVMGEYTITYSAEDNAGNTSSVERTVNVIDQTPPVITLNGEDSVSLLDTEQYEELGATAIDNIDGVVAVNIEGTVDSTTAGVYTLTYIALDSAGNEASVTRQVTVNDGTAPVITLNGENPLVMFTDEDYVEPGAVAIDNVDGNVVVNVSGSFDINTAGNYTITYTASDSAGNQVSATRDIEVKVRRPFITTWFTGNDGASEDNQILILANGNGKYSVDWGDGNTDENLAGNAIHSYVIPGVYTVQITSADEISFYMNSVPTAGVPSSDNYKLLSIEQWGDIKWSSMEYAFKDAVNLRVNATDNPDLSNVTSMKRMFSDATNANPNTEEWDVSSVTDMSYMFTDAENFNQSVNHWDVSNVVNMTFMFSGATRFNRRIDFWDVSKVTDMSYMFHDAYNFNQDISEWDVSSVKTMEHMFYTAPRFNQDIGNWDVSNVTDMSGMFLNAYDFNQDLNGWDVSASTTMGSMFANARSFNTSLSNWDLSSATSLAGMFAGASSFNQDLSNWDVSNIQSMVIMFREASSFNQDLSTWDVSNVVYMGHMFREATSFNQSLNSWDVSKVEDMDAMFRGATSFNQDLSDWDVSNVTDMSDLFRDASSFNQDISAWDVSKVVNMRTMFDGASSFNQDIGSWDVSSVTTMYAMFYSATDFDQDLGDWNISNVEEMGAMFSNATLSVNNYNSLLIGWSSQQPKSNISFHGGNSQYSVEARAARGSLVDQLNWSIFDGGETN